MNQAFLQELLRRRPEIERLWRARLKAVPAHTPLANPDVLAFMIGPTLTQLFRGALERPSSSWAPQSPPVGNLVEAASRCVLNPMIGYHLAGEAALTTVIHDLRPDERFSENEILVSEGELLALLRQMGRAEVTGFCEICLIKAPAVVSLRATATVPMTCPFKASKSGHE